jgi:hypothetical protein
MEIDVETEFKPVEAPRRRDIGQPFEEIPLPERRWYQWVHDVFSLLDELGEAQLKALNVIIRQNNIMIQQLSVLTGVTPPGVVLPAVEVFREYMTEDQLDNKGVVNKATPVDIEVLATLGRTAKYGFVYSETGTIILKINDKSPIPVKVADFFDIGAQHLEVEKLRIETDSVADLTFRMLLV